MEEFLKYTLTPEAGLVFTICVLVILVFVFYSMETRIKDPNGSTLGQVRKLLMDQPFFKDWDADSTYRGGIVKVEAPDHILKYNMRTGIGQFIDNDFDGCCINGSFEFTIGPSKADGQLTILRKRD